MDYQWGIDDFTLTLSEEDKEMLLKLLHAASGLLPVTTETTERGRELAQLLRTAPAGEPFPISREDFNDINALVLRVGQRVGAEFDSADWMARHGQDWPGIIPKFSGAGPMSARFSLDDRSLVIQSEGQARVWDLATGHEVEQHGLDEFAVFMMGSDRWCSRESIWRMWIGQEVQHSSGAEALMARNHGRALLRRNGSALLWDTAAQQTLGAFKEPYLSESCVVLSPDGAWLLNSGIDSTACLRDAATGELIRCLEGHKGLVRTAAFSADGRWAVTASVDYTVRIWDLATGKWVAALHSGHAGTFMVIDPAMRYDMGGGTDADGSYWLEALGSAGWSRQRGTRTRGLLPTILVSRRFSVQ